MTQVVTKEKEVAKTYFSDVCQKEWQVNLDWHDFERQAQAGRPAVAVRMDEPLPFSELMAKSVELAKQHIGGTLSGLIIASAYKKGEELMMLELDGMNAAFDSIISEEVNMLWGLRESEEIVNSRCVTVFAFEK